MEKPKKFVVIGYLIPETPPAIARGHPNHGMHFLSVAIYASMHPPGGSISH